jgi:hypothetical protein
MSGVRRIDRMVPHKAVFEYRLTVMEGSARQLLQWKR